MSRTIPKVLVIGGGPAGIGAALELAEFGRGRIDIDMVLLHDRLGGKASSWRDDEGYLIETGYHIFVGFYDRLRALMDRASIPLESVVHSGGGINNCYEAWSGRVHTLTSDLSRIAFAGQMLTYDGMPFWHRQSFNKAMAFAYLEAFTGNDLTIHDDVCFSTWAIEHGLRPEVTEYSFFRFFREAYFNWPEEISAYAMLQSARQMHGRETAVVSYPTAGMTENLWNPLGDYFCRLGGRIFNEIELIAFHNDNHRVDGVWVKTPKEIPEGLRPHVENTHGEYALLNGYDEYVSAVPVAAFRKLNPGDDRFWEMEPFQSARNIRSATTMSLTAWTEQRSLNDYQNSVFGLDAPLGIVTDYKDHVEEWRTDPRFESVLGFWGQEKPFEDWSDDAIISRAFAKYSSRLGYPNPLDAGIVHLDFHRNEAPTDQVFLCEPGINRFRPGHLTPLENLKLCGDWVRNEVDIMCMEGALTSGQEAAAAVLEGYSASRELVSRGAG